MDIRVAEELVAMRHEQLAGSRGPAMLREQRRAARRDAVRTGWLRLAMWSFGAGVVAPRVQGRVAVGGAQPECAPQA